MTRRITDEDIEKAVLLLDSWPNKLSWERFLAILETEIGCRYSKTTMLKYTRVANAFAEAKERIRSEVARSSGDGIGTVRHGDVALARANERIKELDARVYRLTNERDDLFDMFRRWQYNAFSKGLTPEELDRPLPPMTKKQKYRG